MARRLGRLGGALGGTGAGVMAELSLTDALAGPPCPATPEADA